MTPDGAHSSSRGRSEDAGFYLIEAVTLVKASSKQKAADALCAAWDAFPEADQQAGAVTPMEPGQRLTRCGTHFTAPTPTEEDLEALRARVDRIEAALADLPASVSAAFGHGIVSRAFKPSAGTEIAY